MNLSLFLDTVAGIAVILVVMGLAASVLGAGIWVIRLALSWKPKNENQRFTFVGKDRKTMWTSKMNPNFKELDHVMPINDLREHIASADCWCKPTALIDEPSVYVHHSMDRREEYEEGRLPS